MSQFPGCFTIGEATTVTHGIILFALSTVTNLPLRYHLPPIHDDDIATTILQVSPAQVFLSEYKVDSLFHSWVFVYFYLQSLLFYHFLLQVGILYVGVVCALLGTLPALRSTKNFYLLTIGTLVILVVPLLHILLDRSPLIWIIVFVFGSFSRVKFTYT